MTFETAADAPTDAIFHVEQLHEFVINDLGYTSDEVLFIAHDDGTITGRIVPNDGRDPCVLDSGGEDRSRDDHDPSPPGIASRFGADVNPDDAPDSAYA